MADDSVDVKVTMIVWIIVALTSLVGPGERVGGFVDAGNAPTPQPELIRIDIAVPAPASYPEAPQGGKPRRTSLGNFFGERHQNW